ncbi:hypothetical protein K437DRAFT_134271 [Tilletiaria anomala UBC 951]|uniref:Uncharacterized protein n=1 Tax=Tilletiaria anomala (strain ATCC 24038 / CBS 436.72 / UBC 951) TaxID=1037660 RepID=A0A066WK79_TILAU|nr:uncharacterized protein K437DRAFT_134271 [Tilletiaria anomala UBC 951]KDN52973.1 hypothetical protein K437DRAFT_134271 [Tilletiaria anomala UBC 951]
MSAAVATSREEPILDCGWTSPLLAASSSSTPAILKWHLYFGLALLLLWLFLIGARTWFAFGTRFRTTKGTKWRQKMLNLRRMNLVKRTRRAHFRCIVRLRPPEYTTVSGVRRH